MNEYDADQEDVINEIIDETMEYAENLERSEEDGWFYSDEDGE